MPNLLVGYTTDSRRNMAYASEFLFKFLEDSGSHLTMLSYNNGFRRFVDSDGVEYIPICAYSHMYKGYSVDQIILVGGSEALCGLMRSMKDEFMYELLFRSCVPDEYKIIEVEW